MTARIRGKRAAARSDASAIALQTLRQRPALLFAPGAGAPSTSEWMTAWADRLSLFADVHRFDYPYQRAGKRRPDPLPRLIAAHREQLEKLAPGRSIILAGKSMGGRVGCHLSLEQPVAALVCFGYPLVSPTGKVRDEVLRRLRTPILFVQGTRDPLCPLDLLAEARSQMTAPSQLYLVGNGDHSLKVGARILASAGLTQSQVDQTVAKAVQQFVQGVLDR